MIAAIGTDGRRFVVWGLGSTEDAARRDAYSWDETWSRGRGSVCLSISRELAARVEDGEVDCDTLGISVTLDAHGFIVGAEVAS